MRSIISQHETVGITILFQKVCLGLKPFPIINKPGGGGQLGTQEYFAAKIKIIL